MQEYRYFACYHFRDKLIANGVKMIGHYHIRESVGVDFKRLGITNTALERFKKVDL